MKHSIITINSFFAFYYWDDLHLIVDASLRIQNIASAVSMIKAISAFLELAGIKGPRFQF